MKEVNDALCYAHKKDTLHCDVSPNNIVVANDKAILIDWGIAMDSNVFPLSHFTGTSAFSVPFRYFSLQWLTCFLLKKCGICTNLEMTLNHYFTPYFTFSPRSHYPG